MELQSQYPSFAQSLLHFVSMYSCPLPSALAWKRSLANHHCLSFRLSKERSPKWAARLRSVRNSFSCGTSKYGDVQMHLLLSSWSHIWSYGEIVWNCLLLLHSDSWPFAASCFAKKRLWFSTMRGSCGCLFHWFVQHQLPCAPWVICLDEV